MRKYESPKLETIEFDVDDVITASSASGGSVGSERDNAYGSFSSFRGSGDYVW